MKDRAREPEVQAWWLGDALGHCVGSIVRVTIEGRPLVDFPGNAHEPVLARSIVGFSKHEAPAAYPVPALLAFEGGDSARPIILGLLRDALVTPTAAVPRDATVDGRRITLDAQDEILLRCGKSSILLRKDGRIIVRGARIVSRSSGTHKIQGSSVNIN